MRNLKLTVEYDGTNFCGWQWQPEGRSIQKILQEAVDSLVQERPTLTASGRTDAGVHALGQVVNFTTASRLGPGSIRKGLNSYLPEDIRVIAVEEVDAKFHARFDAKKRRYRYVITKRPVAVERYFSWHCKYKLDLKRMQIASNCLLGEHNFLSFCKREPDQNNYLVTVESADWHEDDLHVTLDICANRFLHHMVRTLVGTMVEVGRGAMQPQEIPGIIEAQDRSRAGATAPPRGLFLHNVYY